MSDASIAENSGSNISIASSEVSSSDLSDVTSTSSLSSLQTHSRHDVPNIRLRAIAKLQPLFGHHGTGSSSSEPPTFRSSSSSSSSALFLPSTLDEDAAGSNVSLPRDLLSKKQSAGTTYTEDAKPTNVKEIMKTKWFTNNMAMACKESQLKEVLPTLEVKIQTPTPEVKVQIPTPEMNKIQTILQNSSVVKPIRAEDVCREVNRQRFQTDELVRRQNVAISTLLVDYVIQEAEAEVKKRKRVKHPTVTGDINILMKRKAKVKWPTIEEFNVTQGGRRILEYIQSWELDDRWGYCVDLLDIREEAFSRYYIYDVQWCIPTLEHPIPSLSVSVYFIYQLSKILPPYYPVTVSFVVEGSCRQHFIEEISKFEEKWLTHVLDTKELLLKKIKF